MHDLVDLHADLLELPARDSSRHPYFAGLRTAGMPEE